MSWETERPRRWHIAGAAIFGSGWAVTDSCPAPIAGQLSQGITWSLFTIAGVLIGIELYLRREERLVRATEPAAGSLASTAGSG